MKIALAQIQSFKGDINANIQHHIAWIYKGLQENQDAIFFPELSLTGYEPTLAKQLALTTEDGRLGDLQRLSDDHNLTIGVGAPTKAGKEILISMLIFKPSAPLSVYSKMMIDEDEESYFSEGVAYEIINIDNRVIAPSICYESLQEEHLQNASKHNPDLYLASVAKSQKGIDKAQHYFPHPAKTHQIPILMVNGIGPSDNFVSAGQSGIWDKDGNVISKLGKEEEGLLLFDTTENSFK